MFSTRRSKSTPLSAALRDLIVRTLDDGKAEEIVVIDLAGKSSIGDYMIVSSGRSSRQVGALAEQLIEKLKSAGYRSPAVEGLYPPSPKWSGRTKDKVDVANDYIQQKEVALLCRWLEQEGNAVSQHSRKRTKSM